MVLKEFTLAKDKGGWFCIVHRKEVFAFPGLVVGSSLESSCVSRVWWHLGVSYSLCVRAEIAIWKLMQSFNIHSGMWAALCWFRPLLC